MSFDLSIRSGTVPFKDCRTHGVRLNQVYIAGFLQYFHEISDTISVQAVKRASLVYAPHLRVPSHFLAQVFFIEDKRFPIHPGIDPLAVIRAILHNLSGITPFQGGSTITQQLYDVLGFSKGLRRRSWRRKIGQTIWALKTTALRPKQAVLRDYLQHVYWGRSYFGLDQAARGYFGVSRTNLSLAQSFFLAERLAFPNRVRSARVISLFFRKAIFEMFKHDYSSISELVNCYVRFSQDGAELCMFLERFHRKLAERTRRC